MLLIAVGRLTSRSGSNAHFFTANKRANWLLVSFGMIGTSLSGVTFISVPGWTEASGMTYMVMVLGYLVGYIIIAMVLLPVYYRFNVVSIYSFLGDRLGLPAHKTGSLFFLLSRTVGASARLAVVATVVQLMICDPLHIPFWATASIILILIALYSASGGIATIVFTDTLQTAFMLISATLALFWVGREVLPEGQSLFAYVKSSPQSYAFLLEGPKSWWRQFLGGISIAVAMTGLDQDMMQKNLTVAKLRDAQKNMVLLGVSFLFVNLVFLSLGIVLSDFARMNGLEASGDNLFAAVVTQPQFSIWLPSLFFIGLLAAAFSSADSALTALTTAICIDFLPENRREDPRVRHRIYFAVMGVVLLFILGIYALRSPSIIQTLFKAAGYTYGPLLGMFAFALLHKNRTLRGGYGVLVWAILAPLASWGLSIWAPKVGYPIGFELLIYNGLLMYGGLWALSKRG